MVSYGEININIEQWTNRH